MGQVGHQWLGLRLQAPPGLHNPSHSRPPQRQHHNRKRGQQPDIPEADRRLFRRCRVHGGDGGYDDQDLYALTLARCRVLVALVERFENTPSEGLALVDFY